MSTHKEHAYRQADAYTHTHILTGTHTHTHMYTNKQLTYRLTEKEAHTYSST